MDITWKTKLLVASIDFGTTYSGFAISFMHDYNDENPKVDVPLWKHGETSGTLKTTTCVLLDQKYKFHSFGYDAEEKYAELAGDNKHKNWHLFRRFKMHLFQDKVNRGLTTSDNINDTSGTPYPAINVFSYAIQYMKDKVIDLVTEKFPEIRKDDIYFVLTTPAIWSQQAKTFMRKAARNAKIPDDHLCIALEPECAAVYLHRTHLPALDLVSGRQMAMKPGSCHLIADLGGGTTDIVAHRVNETGNFEEIIPPCGGPFGSDQINGEFENFLIKVSGGQVLNELKSKNMEDFLTLQRRFEQKKCSYTVNENDTGDSKVTIDIPFEYIQLHHAHNNEDLKSSVRQTNMKDAVEIKSTKMRIRQEFFNTIFKKTIDGVVDSVKEAVKRSPYKIDTIFCTGGFSDCHLLKKIMKQSFPDHSVITSTDAVSTVMKGAVIYGRNHSILYKRISPCTFGLDWNEDFDSCKHPNDKKQRTEYGFVCTDIFKLLVRKDELVKYDEPTQEIDAYTTFKYQDTLEFPFYRSEVSEDPDFVTDVGCHHIGSLNVKIQHDVDDGDDCKHVKLRVYFGATEIKAEATDDQNRKFEVILNFSETQV
ncbi:hypothetical protein ACF0H5_020990 [Mactra antiquata]